MNRAAGAKPTLDLAALLATKAFDEEDLTQNRHGALSAKQLAWCKANPRFVALDENETSLETITGRIVVEGQYLAARMGETTFAQLVLPGGRRLSLQPTLKRALVHEAPYRAYVAHEWVWSIEPISESDLAPTGSGPYRSAEHRADNAEIARALGEAFSVELSFDADDVVANRAGHFSSSQRSKGYRMLFSATLRLLIAGVSLVGLIWLLVQGAAFPVFGTLLAFGVIVAGLVMCVHSFADALARILPPKPLRAIARLEDDPANRDRFILESKASPLKIARGALAISEAPVSTFRSWRFEVHFVPWTRTILTVRPLVPGKKKNAEPTRDNENRARRLRH